MVDACGLAQGLVWQLLHVGKRRGVTGSCCLLAGVLGWVSGWQVWACTPLGQRCWS